MVEKIKKINILIIIFLGIMIIKELSINNENTVSTVKASDKKLNLMIVAHPDDETIWGGAHLLEGDYLVVCVTCGVKENRVKEFKEAMKISGDDYIMLGYPDKINNKRSNWNDVMDDIEEELNNLINSRNWDKIITHNPEGEYGHIHHKLLNKIVTKYADKSKLYYFGKYYKKDEVNSKHLNKISNNSYDIKVSKMIEVYKSQDFIKKQHGHMFEYENWISYSDWK